MSRAPAGSAAPVNTGGAGVEPAAPAQWRSAATAKAGQCESPAPPAINRPAKRPNSRLWPAPSDSEDGGHFCSSSVWRFEIQLGRVTGWKCAWRIPSWLWSQAMTATTFTGRLDHGRHNRVVLSAPSLAIVLRC